MTELDFSTLRTAVDRSTAAIRAITVLQPAGGDGDKVFPPTYLDGKSARGTYAYEERRINGATVPTVLLDSVASQANRMEEALLEGWRRGELDFPVVGVDFREQEDLQDLELITSLQAPHRIADAILRDSLLEGKPFRTTEMGQAITDARLSHATAMYRYCPTALIFGVWDSTGPKGGQGAKFQRALSSEIVGVGVQGGVKVSSRIDPLSIQKKAGPVYGVANAGAGLQWTTEKPGEKSKMSSPAEINHGNIPPSTDPDTGGITFDRAQQTTVLSLPALRRLRFTTQSDFAPIPAAQRDEAELAARTTLAALALAGIVYLREVGYDLRSRAQLVPTTPLTLEMVAADGSEARQYSLSLDGARGLLAKAHAQASELHMGWPDHEILLTPSPQLCTLIRRSRDLAAQGETDEAAVP